MGFNMGLRVANCIAKKRLIFAMSMNSSQHYFLGGTDCSLGNMVGDNQRYDMQGLAIQLWWWWWMVVGDFKSHVVFK